jgi:hypothetical protein
MPTHLGRRAARGGTRLCNQQGDFARQPVVAPIKTHLTPELACNCVFHNARAEAAVRGAAGRAARLTRSSAN